MEQQIIKTEKNYFCEWKNPKFILQALGLIILGGIAIASLLREKIVSPNQNQVTVFGQGKVEYQPDEVIITLGVQVDKVWSAEAALKQLNEKITRIIEAEKNLGIQEADIKTGSYNLSPQYDYQDGISSVSGYTANQNLIIKIQNIKEDKEKTSQVIAAASSSGANQVLGVEFKASNLEALKQEARLKAIADAKNKAPEMFRASGLRVGKVTGWYENNFQFPQSNQEDSTLGLGGVESSAKTAIRPQIPSGTQEIGVEIGLNFEVK